MASTCLSNLQFNGYAISDTIDRVLYSIETLRHGYESIVVKPQINLPSPLIILRTPVARAFRSSTSNQLFDRNSSVLSKSSLRARSSNLRSCHSFRINQARTQTIVTRNVFARTQHPSLLSRFSARGRPPHAYLCCRTY